MVAKAYATGPANLTAPLVNINIVLVILMSVIFFKENLNVLQIFAIILLLSAVSILTIKPNLARHKLSSAWWYWILLAIFLIFCREGGIKVMQEMHANLSIILAFAYLTAFLYFTLIKISSTHKNVKLPLDNNMPTYSIDLNGASATILNRQNLCLLSSLTGMIAGTFSSFGLLALSNAIKIRPASIIVPIFSMRSVVIILLSFYIYKEKLAKHQIIALLILLAAVILIGAQIC